MMAPRSAVASALRAQAATLVALADEIEREPETSPAPSLERLDVDEIARRCRVSRRTVLEAHRSGALVAERVGRKVLATPASVDAWLSSRRRRRPSPDDLDERALALVTRTARGLVESPPNPPEVEAERIETWNEVLP